MAAFNFDKSISYVLAHEGGFVNDPQDPGGATNLGITIGVLSGFLGRPATVGDVKRITKDTAKTIYRRQYWDAVNGDELPSGIDYLVFDYAVNSGPSRAKKTFQKVLPNYSNDKIDGNFGVVTIRAAKNVDDVMGLIDAFTAERLRFLRSLKGWKRFGRGWERRCYEVASVAKKMASTKVTLASDFDPLPDPSTFEACPSPRGVDAEVRPVSNRVVQALSVGTGSGTLSGVSGAVSQAAQSIQPLAEAFDALKWVFIGLTVISVGIGLYVAISGINNKEGDLS